jgi:hypothetical protein
VDQRPPHHRAIRRRERMWIPFSVDAIATVRFLGIYSLSAVDLVPPIAGSSPPNLDKQCLY